MFQCNRNPPCLYDVKKPWMSQGCTTEMPCCGVFVLGYKPHPWDVWRGKGQCLLSPPAKCGRASGKTVGLVEITFSLIFHEQTQGCLGEVHVNDIIKQYIMGCARGTTLQPHSWLPGIPFIRSYLQQCLVLLCKQPFCAHFGMCNIPVLGRKAALC